MLRTLLTGFGPFGKVVNNPSARIVEQLAQAGARGHELTTRLLPVSYARADQEIRELLATGRYDAALLLGVARQETQLRLEQCGRRRSGEGVDCDGRVPPPVDMSPGMRADYPATVPLEPLLAELVAHGLPARLSDDAGRYVCNHTYFAALETIAAENLPTRCLFLHVPADPETFHTPPDGPAMPLRLQIEAVDLILAWLVQSPG